MLAIVTAGLVNGWGGDNNDSIVGIRDNLCHFISTKLDRDGTVCPTKQARPADGNDRIALPR